MLSVLLPYTDSDYLFGIFKLFLFTLLRFFFLTRLQIILRLDQAIDWTPYNIEVDCLFNILFHIYLIFIWHCSTLVHIQGGVPGVCPRCAPPPPLKLEKNMIFWRKIVIFHTKYLGAIFLSAPLLTWNPGSAPDIGGIVDHYCLNFLFIEKPRIEVESSYNTFTNRCTNI